MDTHHELQRELWEKINQSTRLYELTIFLIENNDPNTALILAARSFRLMSQVIEKLKSQNEQNRVHLETIISNRMKSFPADLKKLSELDEQLKDREVKIDSAETAEILKRMGQNIDILRKELRKIHPQQILISDFFSKHWKHTLLFVSAVAVLVFGSMGIRTLMLQHHGLTGRYFRKIDFTGKPIIKVDPKIDFLWKGKPPFKKFKKTKFSVQWSGFLDVPQTNDYDFMTLSDDGVRLYIDNQLLIDNWTTHGSKEDQKLFHLEKGLHPIKLEYYQNLKYSVIKLFWKTDNSGNFKIIPPKNFYPEDYKPPTQ